MSNASSEPARNRASSWSSDRSRSRGSEIERRDRPAGARKAEASTGNQLQVRAAVARTLTSGAARSCAHMPGLPIREHLTLPLDEIELRTSRSSGPGGQHANVTASRVEAVFEVGASGTLSD